MGAEALKICEMYFFLAVLELRCPLFGTELFLASCADLGTFMSYSSCVPVGMKKNFIYGSLGLFRMEIGRLTLIRRKVSLAFWSLVKALRHLEMTKRKTT